LAVASSDLALGQVINASSSFEISIGDTAALIAQVMHADVEIFTDEQRLRPDASEVNRLFGDNTRLRELTGWQPVYGGHDGFRRGLEKTVSWFRNPSNLARYRPGSYSV
jgi:nucleoside-diphosphate-sugar epimerase